MSEERVRPVANRVLDECESTNDLARELALTGAPEGTWVSARRQTAGRGRQGRSWDSSEGNLFLSFISRPSRSEHCTWIPLASALAVCEAIESRFGPAPIRVKWPNDLWVLGPRWPKGAKLGGILCEAILQWPMPFVVIGVGMNCAHAPANLDQPTASLTEALGKSLDADDVRPWVTAALGLLLAELHAQGPEAIARRYANHTLLSKGDPIEWTPTEKPGVVAPAKRGTVIGLGSSAELLVRTQDGREARLLAEDVRLNFAARLSSGARPS